MDIYFKIWADVNKCRSWQSKSCVFSYFLYFILETFCAKTLQHRIANLLQLNILYHDPLEYTTYNVWLF